MTTLADIRFLVEQDLDATLQNVFVVNGSNDAQTNIGVAINIPATSQILINTTDLKYTLPSNLKQINRLWLQSDFDNGMDREFKAPYRIYNGEIIFPRAYIESDTLNVDYYKNMTYFTTINDVIDLEERFVPLYTAYLRMRYYQLPDIKKEFGNHAEVNAQTYSSMYETTKRDVIAYYSLKNDPVVVQERW